MNNNEVLLSQYADDTCIALDGSEKSLKASLDELNYFGKLSGLKINFSKTQVIWIGSKKFSNDTLCNNYNLHWGNTQFNYLGIEYDVDLNKIIKLNYDKKLVKIKNLLSDWKRRILTPIGKISVIKTLIISQLNHLFLSLPNPSEFFLRNLNDILFKFIWNEKIDKIKRNIMTNDYYHCDLKMLDLHSFMMSLKSTWVRRLF